MSERARRLRRVSTTAEQRLWAALRNRQLDGVKFRRQHSIGPYVVEFACPSQGLVVEVDGGQHAITREADAHRTRALEAEGYRVVRFCNTDVLRNLVGVLEAIRMSLGGDGSGG